MATRAWRNEVSTIPESFHLPICNRLKIDSLYNVGEADCRRLLPKLQSMVFEIMPREVYTDAMRRAVTG